MYLVSEIKHVEETQVEDAVEAEEARHGRYLGAGVRREGEGGEGGRGGGGGWTQRTELLTSSSSSARGTEIRLAAVKNRGVNGNRPTA